MNTPGTGQFMQKLFDSMTGWAMFLVDIRGAVRSRSTNATALFGYERDEVEGRHFTVLYTSRDIKSGEPTAELKSASAKGLYRDFGYRLTKSGQEFECEFAVYTLPEDGGRLHGFIYFIRADALQVSPAVLPATAGKRETILVVDDDEGVRSVAIRQLARLGYEVIEASTGSEALAIIGKGAKVDLLFTDVVMPEDIGGKDLSVEARKLSPTLKIVFASGYFEGALAQRGDLERNVHFLAKPYRKAELAQKIHAALTSGSEPGENS